MVLTPIRVIFCSFESNKLHDEDVPMSELNVSHIYDSNGMTQNDVKAALDENVVQPCILIVPFRKMTIEHANISLVKRHTCLAACSKALGDLPLKRSNVDNKSKPSVLTSATIFGCGHGMCGSGQCAADLGHIPEHLNAGVICTTNLSRIRNFTSVVSPIIFTMSRRKKTLRQKKAFDSSLKPQTVNTSNTGS
uniref:Uncharacterized protein n=1 Tax=Glossina pallidipes TaxID=7398 RepID=A0A1A9ZA77_GLOPL